MSLDIEHDTSVLDEAFEEADIRYRTGFSAKYAAPVNYGTEAHWPPLTPMVRWTDRMGWDNPGVDTSMSEDELWNEVSRRQTANEPLPAAYGMAKHIAENGTEPMQYGSDAFTDAVREGESWVDAQGYDATAPPSLILREFASWTFTMAQQYLNERVSRATTGNLLQSGFPPVEE
jgi:hypothetical protein